MPKCKIANHEVGEIQRQQYAGGWFHMEIIQELSHLNTSPTQHRSSKEQTAKESELFPYAPEEYGDGLAFKPDTAQKDLTRQITTWTLQEKAISH